MTSQERTSELLQIRDLSVSFDTDDGAVQAVDNVSLDIARGEALGLVGESGCGKSVTALSILRLVPSPPGRIESGRILFEGEDLLALPIARLREFRGSMVGMIFQEPMTALSPLHRVGRQLCEVLRLHRDIGRTEAWRQGTAWLTKVGMPDAGERMFAYPHQLSGGMRQRVMIAMALILGPSLVIADEPTTALDVTIQAQVFDLLRARIAQQASLLLITHDMGVIWEMCSRVAVMYASEIVETGTVHEIFEDARHPYAQALLASIPALSHHKGRLPTIEGQVPSPLAYPEGCRFRDRCPHAFERCRDEHPVLFEQGPRRRARCFLAEQPRSGDTAPVSEDRAHEE